MFEAHPLEKWGFAQAAAKLQRSLAAKRERFDQEAVRQVTSTEHLAQVVMIHRIKCSSEQRVSAAYSLTQERLVA